jgi:malonyl-CoA/methylmalonyl-CoA synthetase
MNLFTTIQNAVPDETKILLEIPGEVPVTYAAFIGLTGRFASVLAANGVRPGDRVAVQVEKSWQALALYLACLRAGAVILPLNTG